MFRDSFWVIGSITGLLMFVLFFWEYVLGIKSIVRLFTDDVISIVNLHRWIGINAVLLLLLHPLTLILESLINRKEILLKVIPSNNYEFQVVLGELIFILVLIVWLSSYLVRKKISHRIWKLIHSLAYVVLPLTYIHAEQIGTFFKSSMIQDNIKITMLIFSLICLYRFFQFIGLFSNKYVVKSINNINKDVLGLNLTPVDSPIKPKRGQFVDIKLHGMGESHPFTVYYFKPENNEIYLAIKKAGKFTAKIGNLKIGDSVYLDGPYGVFTKEAYLPTSKKIVLIAGGIGITPFIQLIEYIKSNYANLEEVVLFYANKTIEDISLKKYLDSLNIPNLKVVICLSREQADVPYEKGHVDVNLMKRYLKNDIKSYQYFMCGPEPLMDGVTAELMSKGVEEKNIFKEEFGW